MSYKYKNIVILGGGLTGSLAAILCSQFAEKVTLIERFPSENNNESLGTPQSHHVHIMSKKGQNLLDTLIPGILQQLRHKGAKEVDWAKNTVWDGPYGKSPRYESGVQSLVFSRKLLDQILFDQVQATSQIHYITASVRGIEFTNSQVKHIDLNNGDCLSGADLYIDARGRTSKIKERLEEIIGPIPQRTIKNKIRCITTVIDHKYDPSEHTQQYYYQANATDFPLGYYASPIENDRILFTAVDYKGNIPNPFDSLKFHPLLRGKIIAETKVFSKLDSHHNQYGKSKKWIDNFMVIGDAVCKLNPVFGHSMTLCVEMVELLANELQKKGGYSSHQLQKKIDSAVQVPWIFVAMDEIHSNVKLPNLVSKMTYFYMNCYFKAAIRNEKIHKTFLQVLHRIKSPWAFLNPLTVGRVFSTLLGMKAMRILFLISKLNKIYSREPKKDAIPLPP